MLVIFSIEVLSGLHAGERRNRRELGTEIESGKLCAEKTDIAGGDKLVGRTGEIEVGAQRSRLKRRALRQVDAERGQKRLQIFRGQVLAIHFDVQHGALCGDFICARQIQGRRSDFQDRWIQDAGVFVRSYLVLKSTVTGSADGVPPAISNAFESFAVPFVSSNAVLRIHVAVEIEDAAEARGWIEETSGGQIQRIDRRVWH